MQVLQMFHTFPTLSSLAKRMMMLRLFLTFALLSVALSALTACSQGNDSSRSERRAITQSQAIATDFLRTELSLSPETASRLRLERHLGPTAIYRLDNHSQAGFERRRLVRIELMQRLQQRPRLPDGHPLARDLAVAEAALVDLIALEQLGYGRFNYADHRPYAMDPYSGIWIEGPAMLAFQQTINNVDQATAYISRLQGLSEAVQDTRRRLIADRASGIVMPRSLANESQRRVRMLLSDDPGALPLLITTFEALTIDLNDLDPSDREAMMALVETEVDGKLRPALQDLSDTLAEMGSASTDQSGIWAQPKGQDLYSGILTAATGESVNIERLHTRQLEDVTRMRTALYAALTVPEDALAEPEVTPPERLSQLSPWFETANLPAPIEETEAPTYDLAETVDALAPGSDWGLIKDTPSFTAQAARIDAFEALWRQQPFLTWRTEGEGELSPQRELIEYAAVQDAWRLYIWTRQVEAADPDADRVSHAADRTIGLIQAVLAATDTGLHLERWTLSEATEFIAVESGLAEPLARQLALRIMARPGYQSAIATAFHRFEILSERSQAVLGARYSETDFQRTLIQAGPRPLPFIEADIEAWYGARLEN